METYITLYKIDNKWEFAIWLKELKLGFDNNLKGWDGETGGRDIQAGRDMGKPMADSCIEIDENCKAIILQLKINLKKKKNSESKDKFTHNFTISLSYFCHVHAPNYILYVILHNWNHIYMKLCIL